jgi:hypothetical protein
MKAILITEPIVRHIMEEEMIPYGSAYINSNGHTIGNRIVFNPYEFKRGKNKGKILCYYRKGYKFKKIILDQDDIIILDQDDMPQIK